MGVMPASEKRGRTRHWIPGGTAHNDDKEHGQKTHSENTTVPPAMTNTARTDHGRLGIGTVALISNAPLNTPFFTSSHTGKGMMSKSED